MEVSTPFYLMMGITIAYVRLNCKGNLKNPMIYTTMTRSKLMRLTGAKGWYLTERLYNALYRFPSPYYEVAFYRHRALLDGEPYDPEETNE